MKVIQVNKDYADVQHARVIKIDGIEYDCVCGSYSREQAEIDATSQKDWGHDQVKIVVCRSYYVCVPSVSRGITSQKVFKKAKKVAKETADIVNKTSGALLTGHQKGSTAVKAFLGWNNKAKGR